MKVIRLQILPGENINRAGLDASKLARKNKCRVRFDFNGIRLFATPKKSPVTIGWEYNLITSQQAVAYRMTPEYRQACAEDEADVKSKQMAIDAWMLMLPNVLRNSLDNTIGWLSNFLPWADRVGTKKDYPLLTAMFEGAGYVADELVGKDEAFYQIKYNLGRYIIGQVLSSWKDGSSVPPIVCNFCEQYEAMRRSEQASWN
jgi:hypothetical protein